MEVEVTNSTNSNESSESESKGGGSVTIPPSTTVPMELYSVESPSEAILPNGLNIKKIKHAATEKYETATPKQSSTLELV